jgi:hypothetical protein
MAETETDKTCAECRKASRRLRKGRCDACYMRLYRNGEPSAGASCAACGERRRPVLVMAEIGGTAEVLCGNCSLVLLRARPRIDTLAELIARREAAQRAAGRIPERRRLLARDARGETQLQAAYRRSGNPSDFDPSVD